MVEDDSWKGIKPQPDAKAEGLSAWAPTPAETAETVKKWSEPLTDLLPCNCTGKPHAGHATERQVLEAFARPMQIANGKTLLAEEPACTCGAASVGSKLHSEWCDARM